MDRVAGFGAVFGALKNHLMGSAVLHTRRGSFRMERPGNSTNDIIKNASTVKNEDIIRFQNCISPRDIY